MFKVNNKGIRTTPMASLLLTLNIFHALPCSSVSTVSFEHVIAGWVWKEGTAPNLRVVMPGVSKVLLIFPKVGRKMLLQAQYYLILYNLSFSFASCRKQFKISSTGNFVCTFALTL